MSVQGWAPGALAPPQADGRAAIDRLVVLAEKALVVLVLAMTTNALLGPLFDPKQLAGENLPWLRLMWLPIYGVIGALAIFRRTHLMRAWRAVLPTALLALFACASAAWSIAPDVTVRRGVALAFTMIFGLYLGARFEWRELLGLVAGLFWALALASLLAAVAYPSLGVASDINAGDWKGLWYEKNELGAMMVLGGLANACSALLARPSRRWFWIAGAVLSLGLLVMSKAGTSLLCFLLVASGLPSLMIVRRGGPLAVVVVWLAATVVAVVGTIAWYDTGILLAAIGKDATLTGRTEIWEALFRRVAERPQLGYGYAAFWNDPHGPAALIRREAGWEVPNAHNGWLDTLVQLGWVGVVLLALYAAGALAVAAVRSFGARDAGFGLLYLCCLLLLSFSESVLLIHHSIKWVLFIAILTRGLTPQGDEVTRPAPPARRTSASPPRPVYRDPEPPGRPYRPAPPA